MYYWQIAFYRLIIFLVFLPMGVFGGTQPADTLIHLDETEVAAPRYRTFSAGHSILQADSTALARYSQNGLDHLLSRQTGIFIKNYGPGILATSSLRGGSAGQTALVWNGFSLQSPATGQTDLALIPVFFTDDAGVQYGGGSALWGSGSMGGAIHLNNNRPSGRSSFARAQISASDMGETAQYLDLFGGRQNIASRLRVCSTKTPTMNTVTGTPIYRVTQPSSRNTLHCSNMACYMKHIFHPARAAGEYSVGGGSKTTATSRPLQWPHTPGHTRKIMH